MAATASFRDLRHHFPRVRALLKAEGAVLLTERGVPKYRLTRYPAPAYSSAKAIDYWTRLTSYQPTPLSRRAARFLQKANRGGR